MEQYNYQRLTPVNYNSSQVKLPDKYVEAYQNVDQAKNLINNRLEKLKYEMDIINSIRSPFNSGVGKYDVKLPKIMNRHNNMLDVGLVKSTNNRRQMLSNHNNYNQYPIDPIYYPMEMPMNAEPVNLPKIELGQPLNEFEDQLQPSDGVTIQDLVTLMNALMGNGNSTGGGGGGGGGGYGGNSSQLRNTTPFTPKEKKKKRPPTPESEPTPKKRTPKKKPNKLNEKPKIKQEWWKVVRNFVVLHKFYIVSEKYGKHSNVRNQIIGESAKNIYPDLDSIKNWLILITQPFFEEFRVFQDLNLSFNNYSGELKIQEQSQKIIAFLNKFFENLLKKTTKLSDVPEKIQSILYKYIKDKAFFPRKYLSTFEINRLDFYFYGSIKQNSDASAGMLLAFLIISRTFVMQLLLHIVENFEEFKTYRNIQISTKYVGSVLHYLIRDTFKVSPPMIKEVLALMNFYRNYKIFNEQIEKKGNDVFSSDITYRDIDELSRNLVPENTISNFFTVNQKWCDSIKKYIYQWSINLAKGIRIKYSRTDKNLDKITKNTKTEKTGNNG